MARTNAISLINSGTLEPELKELYGYVIENVQKNTLSSALKSQAYTGNPATGSVEFRRFKNSTSKNYGTARNASKGDAIATTPITVNLDQHKEIVEECAKFDLDTFGVGGIMARRVDDHIRTMTSDLDVAFFAAAFAPGGGNAFTPGTGVTDLAEILEAYIQKLETVKNEYVRGVNRNQMVMVCSPKFYGKIRNLLDSKPNGSDTASENFGMFHGVRIYSSVNIPTGQNAVLMIDGAIAQPVVIYPYTEPEKIPLSNDFAVSLFYDYGTTVLTPDLVFTYAAPST